MTHSGINYSPSGNQRPTSKPLSRQFLGQLIKTCVSTIATRPPSQLNPVGGSYDSWDTSNLSRFEASSFLMDTRHRQISDDDFMFLLFISALQEEFLQLFHETMIR